MPVKLALPESQVASEWLANINATTRTLAKRYGCSYPTIGLVLQRQLGPETIDRVKREKISASTAARPDLRTEANRMHLRQIGGAGSPEAVEARRAAGLRGFAISADRRRGRPLTAEHRANLSASHLGIHAGSKHPNWRGGTSAICWRGTGWSKARKAARERDGNCCTLCGKTAAEQGRSMDVHHRVSYFVFSSPQEANALSNLVCLCRVCHRKVENGTISCP